MGIACKSRIMWSNEVDSATLSATSERAGYPVVMLQDLEPTMLWKSNNLDPQTITLSWDTPQIITCVCLVNHNLSYTGTITVSDGELDLTFLPWESIRPFCRGPFGIGPIGGYPSPREIAALAHHPLRIYYLPGPLFTASLTVTLNDPDNSQDHLSLGGLFVGSFLQPSRMFDSEHLLGVDDLSESQIIPGGQTPTVVRPTQDTIQFKYANLSAPEALTSIRTMLKTVGTHQPIIIDPFALGPAWRRFHYAMHVKLDGDTQIAMKAPQRSEVTLAIRQAM